MRVNTHNKCPPCATPELLPPEKTKIEVLEITLNKIKTGIVSEPSPSQSLLGIQHSAPFLCGMTALKFPKDTALPKELD